MMSLNYISFFFKSLFLLRLSIYLHTFLTIYDSNTVFVRYFLNKLKQSDTEYK